MKIKLDRCEISGGLADIGTLLPILVALVAVNHVNPFVALLACGLFYTLSSIYYQLPVPVQPLKVFCTVAIATKASPALMNAGAILIGVTFLVLAVPQVMNIIKRLFPLPVIRGIQLGTGLLLIDGGIKFLKGSQVLINGPQEIVALFNVSLPTSLVFGVVYAVIFLLLLRKSRYPIALILLISGIFLALWYGAHLSSPLLGHGALASLGAFERLQQADFIRAFWLLVLPQIPLSVGNAIIASEHTLRTYFPEQAKRVQASSLAFGMGCFNVLAGICGGIPCCHGSGGVTAHYRLGARSGTATFFTGLFYCSLAIAVFYFGVSVFSFFPYPVLGVLLIYVGIEHGLLIHDISTRLDLATVLVIAAITVTTRDMTIAFLVGMIFYQIARSQKISL